MAALQRAKAKKWYKRLTGYSQTTILDVSAWYRTIELHRHDAEVLVVGAQLDSGAYVQGDLFTYSVASREDEHRDLVLTAPIELRTADGVTHTLDVKYSVISARHIVRLDVTPVQPEPADEPKG